MCRVQFCYIFNELDNIMNNYLPFSNRPALKPIENVLLTGNFEGDRIITDPCPFPMPVMTYQKEPMNRPE